MPLNKTEETALQSVCKRSDFYTIKQQPFYEAISLVSQIFTMVLLISLAAHRFYGALSFGKLHVAITLIFRFAFFKNRRAALFSSVFL